MQSALFEVLSQAEVERIHDASMALLKDVVVKVDYRKARDLFREAGEEVEDESQTVRLSEDLIWQALEEAPGKFRLYGSEPDFSMEIGGG